MRVRRKRSTCECLKFFYAEGGKEVARARLYILQNDLHQGPFGFLEDVFVDENFRRRGLATRLVKAIIKAARAAGCYKLVACSRYDNEKVHELYVTLGFQDHGVEFRMNFDEQQK